MLNQLHKKLTLLCTFITATILLGMTFIVFIIYENQLNAQSMLALESHLNDITYRLQTDLTISQTWLSQLEFSNNLVISIEDNKQPFLFKGVLPTLSNRTDLIEKAHDLSLTQYAFDPYAKPTHKLQPPTATFKLYTPLDEHFLVGISTIPSANGFYTLTLLKDMKNEDSQIFLLRIIFILLLSLAIALLYFFSLWFTRRALEPVKESNRKQVAFIAAASHELRSPLAVLQASACALNYKDADNQHHFITIIDKECKRMGRLVDDLLLLANADSKNWSVSFSSVELDTLLLNLYDAFSPISKARGISLHLNLPDEYIPPAYVDSERLEQVFTILLDNAFSYTQQGGTITIHLLNEPNCFKIKVIDNGCGIPDEHKPYIFDRFYRVDSARHTKEHYGLGLSIAYELVKLHNGQLSLMDTPGGGATFTTHFPKNKNA